MNNKEIRNYIEIASIMITENEQVVRDDVILTEASAPRLDSEVDEQMQTLIFKLRGYRDPELGEFADGVESGMSRAADMIENLLERMRG
jgi:hypothetical protein